MKMQPRKTHRLPLLAAFGAAMSLLFLPQGAAWANCHQGPYWYGNPTGYNSYSGLSIQYDACQFATDSATQSLARAMGATVVSQGYDAGPFRLSQPMNHLQLAEGNGNLLNAGLVMRLYATNPRHIADAMIAADSGVSGYAMPTATANLYAQTGASWASSSSEPERFCDMELAERFRHSPMQCNSKPEFQYDYDARSCNCR